VLIGRPNVGKSSLLNRLVREDAAIVTPLPGTTRDTVQRQVEIAGIPLTVVDTAGLRDTQDPVESVGIERTWAALRTADLALVLVDARDAGDALAPGDAAIVARLDPALPRVVVHNKADLAGLSPSASERGGVRHVVLSALSGEGIALLEREVLAIAGASTETDDTFLARARHLAALRDADAHLVRAAGHLAQPSPPLELFAEELRIAHDALATITGAFTPDDLIGVIFARFCIGK
jgi:tRNA modification GTPase